jgi:uncharacterized protein
VSGETSHFEIYGKEPAKLAEFYAGLFGWNLEKAHGVDYWRIQIGSRNCTKVDGGITYRPPYAPHSWLQYVNVDSIDRTLADAERMGASVLMPKTAVPKTGWYAVLADPQKNAFAVWQADTTAFPTPKPD